jgi:NAD(P)-dependent dehydrogenase (short-subunit alcohol dehydrogenase family)
MTARPQNSPTDRGRTLGLVAAIDRPQLIPHSRRIILITGGSRGVGAATARHLASPSAHVIVTYREKSTRADDVVSSIVGVGGSASAVRLDICDPTACADVIRSVRDEFGKLDALILHASGGLERGADPDYPMRVNRDAPVHLLNRALPLFPPVAASSSSPATKPTSTASNRFPPTTFRSRKANAPAKTPSARCGPNSQHVACH